MSPGTIYEFTIAPQPTSNLFKAGHRIVIADNGDYQGLVSGGCLEGDLAEHAKSVLENGQSLALTYDLRDEADEIWGMGIGCNGVIQVLLQRLDAASGYEPYQTLAQQHMNGPPALCATVIESNDKTLEPGATFINDDTNRFGWHLPKNHQAIIAQQIASMSTTSPPQLVDHQSEAGAFTALYAPVHPLPRLLVLGGGPDAVPLVNMAEEIGWLVTIVDHRATYLESGGFDTAEKMLCIAPEQLENNIELDRFVAIVVMSHHLESDRAYLGQLAGSDAAYIGVLGPRDRRDRLIAEIDASSQLASRLKGPVGLDIGADSPESIALSVLAEIHQTITT